MSKSDYLVLEENVLELVNSGEILDALNILNNGIKNLNKNAFTILANMNFYGFGVPEDVEKAIDLYNSAINLGSEEAALELGLIYFEGKNDYPVDIEKGIELFGKGASFGNIACLSHLSDCYLFGHGGVTEEPEKGFEYASRTAKAGFPKGMFNLGICYDDGIGTKKDPFAASYWYKEFLEYEPEDDFVMLRIGLCLADPYESFGFRPSIDNLNEAYQYISKSVERGNIEAHIIIGWFFERGEIVSRDFDLSHKYIKIAADNGNDLANDLLKRYRKNIYGNYFIPNYE